MLLSAPLLYLLMSSRFRSEMVSHRRTIAVAVTLCAIGVVALLKPDTYASLWTSARMAGAPIFVACMVLLMLRNRASGFQSTVDERRLLTVSVVAVWFALVQFPFAPPVYFVYTAPFVVLAATALVVVRGTLTGSIRLALLVAITLFGLTSRRFFFHYELSSAAIYDEPIATLLPGRGDLQVRSSDAALYARIDSLVRVHSRTRAILAGPDAPEITFLVRRDNPTRLLFDFFEDSLKRISEMRRLIRSGAVDMVILNRRAEFSGPPMPALVEEVNVAFPFVERVDRFEVRWRKN
jgi:hypothetical protein